MDTRKQQMAKQVKHAFIVTSAINSKFGVFTPEQRLEQTISTIKSIREKLPTAVIVVMECCGTPVTKEQAQALKDNSDYFFDYSNDLDVQALYNNDNWDVVKNGTEIMVFGRLLNTLHTDGTLKGVDRIHKMSGRYILNDMFDPETYEQTEVKSKFVIGPKYQSQFPIEVTQVPLQYMARLWSWPADKMTDAIQVYEDSLVFFAERLAAGGYVDIEHVLYKFLPPAQVHEIQNLGVEGCIAPNGQPIKN
ncbi:hypothetical protein UFOVP112_218 [uncultured Caudovirales phage]|uniref:Uncharacterized protein n=1 Tax=uncultured Caudovirales phage TaxID=2100421 RepID=A0A6J5L8Q2_9CAUD|nr:hypothetical protein UFOVP112_218 [uncultured Caudovirales phage]